MKKLFKSLFVIVAAMITFAGCVKEEVNNPVSETKTVKFFAEAIETKTAFGTPTEGSYPTLWTEGDKVKVFLNLSSVENFTTEKTVTVDLSESDGTSAKFEASIDDTGAEDFTFYAVSPSIAYVPSSRNANTNSFAVKIPSTQEPIVDSVDPNAQVLYAISNTEEVFPESVSFQFKHFTAYCKLSFSGIDESLGNEITSVRVKSDDLNFVGEWELGLDGNHKPKSEADNDEIQITTSNSENIWFACAPVDVRGKNITFIVETNVGTATRNVQFPNDETYQFKSGEIANLKVNMSDAVISKPETVQYFTKVETAPADWSGTYLIVYEAGNVAFNGNLSTLDAVSNTVPVTIVENKIQYTESLANSTFVIAKSGDSYSVKSASGYYIGQTSNANGLQCSNSTVYSNTLAINNGDADITSASAYLRYNNTSGQYRFRYYKSSSYGNQKAIQLYKLDGSGSEGEEGGETPEPELQERNLAFSSTKATATVGEDFAEPTLSGVTDGVVYSSSNPAVATVNASTGDVTLIASGTTTITATAVADAEYAAGEASYTLTVSAVGDNEDIVDPVKIDITFSDYTAGVQYALNEVHKINEVLTLYTTQCHFTTQLRIYSSSTHNGFVVSNQLPGKITDMTFNAGNNTDSLDIYGSNDGSTWTKVGSVAVTSTYKDYSFSFGDNTEYTYFKLDVAGEKQIRIAKMSVTYQPAS